MRLLKKSIGLVAASSAFFAGTVIAQQMPFNDVPANHWASQAVNWVRQHNIMTGPGDMPNQFLPARSVNRAELATVLSRLYMLLSDEMEELEERVQMLEEDAGMVSPNTTNNGFLQQLFPDTNQGTTQSPGMTTSPAAGTGGAAVPSGQTLTGTGAARTVTVTLGGNEEVPPVSPSGRGTGQFTLNESGLMYDIRVEGLTSPITAAHFHHGAREVNGPIIEPIVFEGSRATGTWRNLTAAERRMIENGEVYVNVHTQRNPAGEVRGQLLFPR